MTMNNPPVFPIALVGAGPGDPELLTLRALKRLQAADVVLSDDLVDARVLALLRPDTRVLKVGKRGGCQMAPPGQEYLALPPEGATRRSWERPGERRYSTEQRFIHELMIREARAGQRVVRLKGGDPFVFGRGGEEVDALRAAGLEVEVVNGLTAGIAGPAAAGIPVTDRRCAPGVALVTGHSAEGSGEGGRAPDWAALARSGLTLVIYMGVTRCAEIVAALRAGGMRSDMPAAVVSAAHTGRQRQAVTTLDGLEACLRQDPALGSPAVLVVGEVAAFAAADLEMPAYRQQQQG
ncbi:uroporphyrinogen-III C-methyltransferase [Roseateles sp. DAIF2]|uniref:uroporphyrinogen-III C-methyltransferase n=1 Tax=Roseateles sp. DAIF2 TaxID=2714952 RepID=UPI0018A262BD|nr:uroporphyrinogen-III C-methyltransferase [Roseateles sp. DAIF2]QPF75716.1 uroporphyrinogen-III C-methyltransferase [Roseateles sp. DAIF2]